MNSLIFSFRGPAAFVLTTHVRFSTNVLVSPNDKGLCNKINTFYHIISVESEKWMCGGKSCQSIPAGFAGLREFHVMGFINTSIGEMVKKLLAQFDRALLVSERIILDDRPDEDMA